LIRKYIEIKQPEITPKAFTDYLKLLYNGFVPNSFHPSMDVTGIVFTHLFETMP
jgi:hypothetical protein